MKCIAVVSLALLGLLCSPAFGLGFICSLSAGSDDFSDSEGVGMITVPGFPAPLPFAACGPTMVVRGDPVGGPMPGQCTIPTEIVAMTLMGVLAPCDPMNPFFPGPALPIMITEDPSLASTGEIVSGPGGSLPASSFFDVFTMVTVGAVPPFPSLAHVVNDTLDAVPPGSTTPGGPPCVMPGDDVYKQGFPAHAHNPCPPKLCCQLPCGMLLHLSCRACQEFFNGHCYEGDCPILCATQSVQQKSWGNVKSIYRE